MKNLITQHAKKEEGFLAIDLLIAVITAALFITAFYQLFTIVNASYTSTRDQAIASNLAYSYVRLYSSGNPPANWFVCDATSGAGNTNDVIENPSAAGQTLQTGTLVPTTVKLPGPTVTYKVTALAVYGCNGTNLNKPVRVESEITYGIYNTVIKHTALVEYP